MTTLFISDLHLEAEGPMGWADRDAFDPLEHERMTQEARHDAEVRLAILDELQLRAHAPFDASRLQGGAVQPPGIELPAFSRIDFLVAAKGDQALAQRRIQALVDRESASPAARPRTFSPSRHLKPAALTPDTMTQIENTELRRWVSTRSTRHESRSISRASRAD